MPFYTDSQIAFKRVKTGIFPVPVGQNGALFLHVKRAVIQHGNNRIPILNCWQFTIYSIPPKRQRDFRYFSSKKRIYSSVLGKTCRFTRIARHCFGSAWLRLRRADTFCTNRQASSNLLWRRRTFRPPAGSRVGSPDHPAWFVSSPGSG